MSSDNTNPSLVDQANDFALREYKEHSAKRQRTGLTDHFFTSSSSSGHPGDEGWKYDSYMAKAVLNTNRGALAKKGTLFASFGKHFGVEGHENDEKLTPGDYDASDVGPHILPGKNDLIKKVEIISMKTNTGETLHLSAPTVPTQAGRKSYGDRDHAAALITPTTEFPLVMVEHPVSVEAGTFLQDYPGVTPSTHSSMSIPVGKDGSLGAYVNVAPVADPVVAELLETNAAREADGLSPVVNRKGEAYDVPLDVHNDHVTTTVNNLHLDAEHYAAFSKRAVDRMNSIAAFSDVTSPEMGFEISAHDPEGYDSRLVRDGKSNADKPLNIEYTVRVTYKKLADSSTPSA